MKKFIIIDNPLVITLLLAVSLLSQAYAAEHGSQSEQVVTYVADFFSRYQPNTALDMVNQVPGFQLDDGSSERGFIGSTGNLLINDKYPSAKQDTPTAILTRIPANQVARIELIRGRVRGIDLQGQSVVANVILRDNSDIAVRWETFIQHSNTGPWKPIANISLSHQWKGIEYNAGINIERESNGERGIENVLSSDGALVEGRTDELLQTGLKQMDIFLNTKTTLAETLLQFNGKFSVKNGPEYRTSIRTPVATGISRESLFKDSQNLPSFELGMDAERDVMADLGVKAILLYTFSDRDFRNLQSNRNENNIELTQRIANSETITQEGIARLELDWTGLTGHNIQLNMEGAYNSVDGSLIQTLDSGAGPVIIDVPGANTRVEEVRGDFALKDTWDLGSIELDYGIGAEVSTITQSGDVVQERDFFFIKPQFVMTYTPLERQQTRVVLLRDVAQLNFDDFISSTVFEDNDLALGNPDLRPDTTWIAELSHEYRFGSLGVIRATVFHHWISDVLDLLPLSSSFEAPGNIGDGRLWGATLETTLPLEWTGLKGARLDLKGRLQDSTVVDPVTGQDRQLSAAQVGFGGPPTIRFRDNGSDYIYDIAFRQDLESARIAWGWDIAEQGERPRYKVNEFELFNEELEVNAFVESTRWFGIKVRLDVNNLLNYTETRIRRIYAGERGLSDVSSTILRERTPGRRIKLTLSGSF